MQRDHSTRDNRDFTDKMNDALGKNYRGYKPKFQKRGYTFAPAPFLKPLRTIGEDGVDHINCSYNGVTELGQSLSFQAKLPFSHEVAGHFNSLAGFMGYFRTEDDSFRTMPGHIASIHMRRLNMPPPTRHDYFDNFYHLAVADAYWQQIRSHDLLAKDVKNSTIPFDMYIIGESGMRIRMITSDILVQTLELIRTALKKNLSYPAFHKLFKDTYDNFFKLQDNESGAAYGERVRTRIKEHYAPLITTMPTRESLYMAREQAKEQRQKQEREKREKAQLAQKLNKANKAVNSIYEMTNTEITEAKQAEEEKQQPYLETEPVIRGDNLNETNLTVNQETPVESMPEAPQEPKIDDPV